METDFDERAKLFTLTAVAALLIAQGNVPARACTGIRLTAADGSVVYARTLEFDADLESDVLIVPRLLALHGTSASGGQGLAWQTRYGARA